MPLVSMGTLCRLRQELMALGTSGRPFMFVVFSSRPILVGPRVGLDIFEEAVASIPQCAC